jgi:hypothetical protein
MEQFSQALWGVATATLIALVPVIRRTLTALFEITLERMQRRLGEGAGRVAGEIIAELQASPEIQVVTEQMLRVAVQSLETRYADTIKRYQIPVSTLQGMIIGELGKLGATVQR